MQQSGGSSFSVSLKVDIYCPSTYTQQDHMLKVKYLLIGVLLKFEKVFPSAFIIINFDWHFELLEYFYFYS